MNATDIVYRPFMDMEVKQDVKGMLYNATDIATAFYKSTGKRKDTGDYLRISSTKEYIHKLESLNTGNPVFKTKRGKYGGTWMNEYLLIDFMMWLDVEFKHKAIEFIKQGLEISIKRNGIKNGYKRMTDAISKMNLSVFSYKAEATMINILVSGSPAKNQRARRETEKLDLADKLQTTNATLILAGLDANSRKDILIKSL